MIMDVDSKAQPPPEAPPPGYPNPDSRGAGFSYSQGPHQSYPSPGQRSYGPQAAGVPYDHEARIGEQYRNQRELHRFLGLCRPSCNMYLLGTTVLAHCAQGHHNPTTHFRVCGIICAVLLFPIGLVCLLCVSYSLSSDLILSKSNICHIAWIQIENVRDEASHCRGSQQSIPISGKLMSWGALRSSTFFSVLQLVSLSRRHSRVSSSVHSWTQRTFDLSSIFEHNLKQCW